MIPQGGANVGTSLKGKTVLVTGASRGIGRQITEHLGREGASVVAHYHSSREGAEAATASMVPDRALLLQADLGIAGEASRLWREAVEHTGRIDAIVCNAAIMPKVDLTDDDETWSSTWAEALQVNTLSQAELIRASTLHYLEHGGGTIVGISSWVTQRGASHPNLGAYAASKAATAALVKTVARYYGRDGVLAYLIAPGAVDTEMTASSSKDHGGKAAMEATLAMGELVPPAEIAELVTVLCRGTLRHLSGATLDVNGASYVR